MPEIFRYRYVRAAFLLSAPIAVAAGVTPALAASGGASAERIWSWWVADPVAILFTAGLGALYARGLREWRPRSRPVRRWQVASFYAGLAVMFIALASPIDALSDRLFFAHQIQHVLLRVAGPVLILLGAPLTPVLLGLPRALRMGLVRPVVSNRAARTVYRWLTHPVWVPVVFLFVLFLWQVPILHDAAVENFPIHYAMHLSMTASAMLFWWLIIDPKPHRSRIHYGVRILIMAATVLPNTVLGAAITFSEHVLYASYGPTRPGGIAPIDDQRWGGLIMWLTADMMTVAVASVIFAMWYAREQAAPRRPSRRAPGRTSDRKRNLRPVEGSERDR